MTSRSSFKEKKRPKKASNGTVLKDHESSAAKSLWTSYRAGLLAFFVVLGGAIILNDTGFISLEDITKFNFIRKSGSRDSKNTVGGWRLANEETLKLYDTTRCGVERVFADEITPKKFRETYSLKKPLILKFRNGAKDWTDPEKWTLKSLKALYGNWILNSGDAVELVRNGGNGYIPSSFNTYVENMVSGSTPAEQSSYVFDRVFLQATDLPKSLRLPKFIHFDPNVEDGLFFLGASGSGISIHNHAEAWNAVIYGRKRWFLYTIDQNPPGGAFPGFTQLEWYQRVYPNLTEEDKPMECIQESGEILYLPEGTFHGTINLGDTVALGIQSPTATLPVMKHIYELTQLAKEDSEESLDRQLELAQELVDLRPESAEFNQRLGVLYDRVQEYGLAERFCQKAVDLDPYFIIAYLNLAEAKTQLGKDEEAETLLKKCLDMNPYNWEIYAKYGMFLKHRQRYEEAVAILRQGSNLDLTRRPFYYYLYELQMKLGNVKAAEEAKAALEYYKQLEAENGN